MSSRIIPEVPLDFDLELSRGRIPGMSRVNKFGRNSDVDTGTIPEDVWDAGGLHVPPTAARTHDLVSSSVNDAGSLVSSGTITGGSTTSLEDSGADFVTDGVAIGDTVIDDTTMEHSIVTAVAATTLTTHVTRHGAAFISGDTYRIVNPSSTGVAVVHVYGLGSDMTEQEEFIIMNGTTNVPTVSTYWRIYRMHSDGAVDRNTSNVGNITATAQTDATVTAQITAGKGQTLMAVYTVPAGKTAFMRSMNASINKQGATVGAMADVELWVTPFATIGASGSRLADYFGIAVDGSSYVPRIYSPPKCFEEQTDIWVRVESVTDSNTDISAGFDLILVNN